MNFYSLFVFLDTLSIKGSKGSVSSKMTMEGEMQEMIKASIRETKL